MRWGETHYFHASGTYKLVILLDSENFTSLKVSVLYCLSTHAAITGLRAQLGRRCLDIVLHLFSHLAFPDTFSSTCTSPVEQASPRSHSLKTKTGSQISHPDYKIIGSSLRSDLGLCFTAHLFAVHLPDQHHVFQSPVAASGSPC